MSLQSNKSTIELVFSALQDNAGVFLSVSEIDRYLFYKYNTSMSRQAIVSNLDKIKNITNNLEERSERRGEKSIPVKVFSLPEIYKLIPENNNNESSRL